MSQSSSTTKTVDTTVMCSCWLSRTWTGRVPAGSAYEPPVAQGSCRRSGSALAPLGCRSTLTVFQPPSEVHDQTHLLDLSTLF
jgi:hypothetical protein